MIQSQVNNFVKLAVRRSPLAPALRKLFRRTPLTPALERGRKAGWEEGARWLLSFEARDTLANPDLHRQLRRSINVDIDTELLLTALRRRLLFTDPDKLKDSYVQEALASLIWQAINNEYVWFVSPVEQERVADLKQTLHQAHADEPVDWTIAALTILYLRPNVLCGPGKNMATLLASIEAMPAWLESMLRSYLSDYEEEQIIRRSIRRLGSIEDGTSKLIAKNYEEYPYPRWLYLDNPKPAPRRARMSQFFNEAELAFLDDAPAVLVAGCGTGSKAIEYALSYGKDARIVAIDLSTASLAYAIRMARKYHVTNIEFIQMDLLDLDQLNETFDVVECTGVLHHLQDPTEGGRAIASRVRPGGIVHISLYSELARRQIVKFRKEYNLNPNVTNDEIRSYRHHMMLKDPKAIDERLSLRWDFFDLNRCKDLLFHPLEHRFTIPQIGEMLSELNLEFRGLEKPGILSSQYWTRYPDPEHWGSLISWHKFELKHPDAFGSLYEVWSKKL
ncbi:bifunctional 2-polyprenyl-6-hydroxyphenol methylase/3-demethylubiquinol 3-O-methyltransferase UbiG [Marinimicrobium sp. ABcell2]|uniref:class I SAM-dependent methyltransferase n=1 Tax=Marinimicrobium sp. ABcell2 TaxID=3069751 RepID=UPI0027AED6AD|nr:class I SAM-dependent methyltransferase [Marinimicrobium sp. ABcell2]MDQ2075843.1 class I SAM-dependent methyltransferase [Marinimicrobium sp. ABcell2]